jgi:hypothetical protein
MKKFSLRKKLILTITLGLLMGLLLGLGLVSGAGAAAAPVDLADLQAAGLSAETIGRYLAQNLDPARLAPPVDAGLLAGLTRLGGDELASAYLELDRQTALQKRRDFSPEVVQTLLDSGLEAEQLKKILTEEARRAARSDRAAPVAADSPLTLPAAVPDLPARPPAPPAAPVIKTPSRPQAGYQDLRPGQAADPALPLPPPPVPYDIRRQRTDGPWVGVTERELADGHLVEVNAGGSAQVVGQEVISRPTGHKVYRYYSGRPDQPRSGPDPAQEQKNREDLLIIQSGGRS